MRLVTDFCVHLEGRHDRFIAGWLACLLAMALDRVESASSDCIRLEAGLLSIS
jgi:hypothetical protein